MIKSNQNFIFTTSSGSTFLHKYVYDNSYKFCMLSSRFVIDKQVLEDKELMYCTKIKFKKA